MRLSPNYQGLIVFGLALGSLLVGIVLARGIKAHDEIASVLPFSRPVDRKSEVRISGLIKSLLQQQFPRTHALRLGRWHPRTAQTDRLGFEARLPISADSRCPWIFERSVLRT